jgi:hypothetical protein
MAADDGLGLFSGSMPFDTQSWVPPADDEDERRKKLEKERPTQGSFTGINNAYGSNGLSLWQPSMDYGSRNDPALAAINPTAADKDKPVLYPGAFGGGREEMPPKAKEESTGTLPAPGTPGTDTKSVKTQPIPPADASKSTFNGETAASLNNNGRSIAGLPPDRTAASQPPVTQQGPQAPQRGAPPQAPASNVHPDSLLGKIFNGVTNFSDQNRLTLMAMAGGLAGAQSWGQGLSRAFTNAVPAMQADMKNNQQNQTVQALIGHGMAPDVARALATNPAALQQYLTQLTGAKGFTVHQYKNIDGSETPYKMDQAGNAYTLDGQPFRPTAAPGGAQLTGSTPEERLAQLPPNVQGEVKAIYEGRQSPTGRNVQLLLPLVNQVYPDFDQKNYPTMLALRKSYTSGKDFQEVQALNTVQGHMAKLADAADGLGNTGFKPWNQLKNFAQDETVGSPALVRFRNALVTTQNELAKAYHGGHVSDSAYAAFNKAINEAQTPEEMRAAIGEISGLLHSKIEAKEAGYRAGMHEAPLPDQYRTENEHAKLAREHVTNYVSGQKQPRFEEVEAQGGQRAAPQQQPPQQALPRVSSPAEAMKLPPGTHFIDAQGNQRIRP